MKLWIEPGDIGELTMRHEKTGEVETIRALCIRPRGSYVGWVLTDGSRLPLRPRTLIRIDIVYPTDHAATEDVVHPPWAPVLEPTISNPSIIGESTHADIPEDRPEETRPRHRHRQDQP